jgi:hypothetical protein
VRDPAAFGIWAGNRGDAVRPEHIGDPPLRGEVAAGTADGGVSLLPDKVVKSVIGLVKCTVSVGLSP